MMLSSKIVQATPTLLETFLHFFDKNTSRQKKKLPRGRALNYATQHFALPVQAWGPVSIQAWALE